MSIAVLPAPPAALDRAEGAGECAAIETQYLPGEPLDLAATLAPLVRIRSDPTTRDESAAGVYWRVTSTPDGPATMRIRQIAGGAHIVAFGPGAERAIAAAPELLGRGDDWSQLRIEGPAWLVETRRRNPGLRLCRSGAVFEVLAHAILEQKVTGLEAHTAWARLHRRYADAAPGPAGTVPAGLLAPLSAAQWRAIPAWEWQRAGVDRARRQALLAAAAVASALERTLQLGRGDEEITRRLRAVPGVGVWTAAETTQRAHGDPDAPSFGDYHLAHEVGYAFDGRRGDDERMRELLEPWRGQRQRIVRLIGLAARREPRRGPRMTLPEHRRG